MTEQTVTLQPGEAKVVTFEAIPHEARTYHVSVNGLSGSFVAIRIIANLSGVVTDAETGSPLGDIRVLFWGIGNAWTDTRTDASGRYVFEGIEPGTYVLRIFEPGYEIFEGVVTLHQGDNELNVSLTPLLLPLANLYGVVFAGKKEIYIDNAKVTIDGVTTYTNASGNYGFEEFFGTAVPPGTYTITVTKEGYQTFETDITLREGANFLDIQLLTVSQGEVNILGITINTSPPVVGKRVALSVSLTNQSGVTASYHLDIYVDGLRILSWNGTLLHRQGSNIGAVFTPTRAGIHTAKADLNYGREVLTKDFEVFPA